MGQFLIGAKKRKASNGTVATLYQKFLKKQALNASHCVWDSPMSLPTGGSLAGLSLIPCDLELLGEDLSGSTNLGGSFSNLEALRANAKVFLRDRSFLRMIVAEVRDRFDYVLIDCPPNLYLMTQNALAASNHYVIPAIPDHLSTVGLNILQAKVEGIAKKIASAATFAGDPSWPSSIAALGGVVFVKTRIGGSMMTNVHSSKIVEVNAMLPKGSCFKTHTTELIGFGEAAENSVPVWHHNSPNARKASKKNEYQDITNEFVTRV